MESLPARIRSKISVSADGCWLWTAAVDDQGYGRVGWEGKNRKAYRVVYLLLRGSIEEGKELDHLCRVRLCVNPDHLEPVTHAVNMERGELRRVLREKWSAPRTCPQGHPMTGENLVIRKSRGRPNRKCRICEKAAIARFKERQRAAAAG